MTIRQPGDVVAVCPVCGAFVDVLNPEQVPRAEDSTTEQHIEAVVEANSAILRAHVEATHTVHEVMLALGQARHALMEISAICEVGWFENVGAISTIADRGLGGK